MTNKPIEPSTLVNLSVGGSWWTTSPFWNEVPQATGCVISIDGPRAFVMWSKANKQASTSFGINAGAPSWVSVSDIMPL